MQPSRPLSGIRVERERPVSFLEKVFNPVGATYFQHRPAQTKVTDDAGAVVFTHTTKKDIYRIYPRDARPLVVVAWEQQAQVSPKTNDMGATKWSYAVSLDDER